MKIGVIGIGTAGVQTIAYLLGVLPEDIEIYSIHNPSIKILGIGESTTTFLPFCLQMGCGFTMLNDGDKLDATTKHGVRYQNWRSKDFNTHILPPYHGMHFNNFKLSEVAFDGARKKWPNRFKELLGEIKKITQDSNSVTVNIDDVNYNFDYVVDCRGYPEDYTDYKVYDDLPVNHCIVYQNEEPGNWNFTYHRAHKNGWMFGIPLTTRQGWGYLYNDTITEKSEALADLANIFGKQQEEINFREFAFKNYHAKKIVNGRIISNGNRALFFEPLEALSGTFYEAVCVEIGKIILNGKSEELVNEFLLSIASRYADFISFVYHGGSVFDSDFWNITTKKSKDRLESSETWNDQKMRINVLNAIGHAENENILMLPVSISLWKLLDDKLSYGYFK